MTDRSELAEQVFLAALAIKPEERSAVLDELCDQDPEIRRMVEDLLAQEEQAGSFLEHPPLEFLDRTERVPSGEGVGGGAAASAGRLTPGQVLNGRWVIVRFIAKGGMGEVYEARDKLLHGPHIALKTILPEIADDPGLRHRFEQEVLSAREVLHPNLCPIYSIEHCEEPLPGFLFLTMKLLPGETLAARLRRTGAVREEEGLAVARQMVEGLSAIHGAGIVHRDIKPNNVILDGKGSNLRLWITDFGLARAVAVESTLAGSRILIAGTPGYIAPELYRGQPASRASDLFAFGVVLHEVFTGERPVERVDGPPVTPSARLNGAGVPSICAELIKGLLDEDPARRCAAFDHALEPLGLKQRERKKWTRRQFVGMAAAAACSFTAAGWFERDPLYNVTHPLPGKRFVALVSWPKTSDGVIGPMLTGALNAIKGELARFEAFDRDLFVIAPEDAHQDISAAAHLKEVCDPLGANLALTASGAQSRTQFHLWLRLLDPIANREIRWREVKCALESIPLLPGMAVEAAEKLLDLKRYALPGRFPEQGTQSTAAFVAFQRAETLMKQPNYSGIESAIEKYKDALDLDPRYALAYARLAAAYVHLYGPRLDPGLLDLARENCERALELDPNLVDARLCLANVWFETGNQQAALAEIAKVLERYPSDPEALLAQGELYAQSGRWSEAENSYQRAVKQRPNFWMNYNQLAIVYHKQGKFPEAIRAFRAASAAAPANAMPLSNLGLEYLQTGDLSGAMESLRKALALAPNSDTVLGFTSFALRYQGKYQDALSYALKAAQVNPGLDENWLEVGECYSSMRNRQSEAKTAYMRAAKEAEHRLQTNPADGFVWMSLALYRAKSGRPNDALPLIRKAESLGAVDMDSQLYKARMLELLGRRDEALATFKTCFEKGATPLEVMLFPDMQAIQKDPRYRQLVTRFQQHLGSPTVQS